MIKGIVLWQIIRNCWCLYLVGVATSVASALGWLDGIDIDDCLYCICWGGTTTPCAWLLGFGGL